MTNEEFPMRLTISCLITVASLAGVACTSADVATEPGRGPANVTTRDGSAPGSVSTTAACGGSVLVDLRLEDDLNCSGDGLIVAADGTKINLNGHTITGAGIGVGITVRSHQDVSIFGGTIRGFVTGVFVATSTDVVIKDNGFTGNREGVFLAGASGNVIKSNVAWDNSSRGIMIRPTGSGALSTNNVVMDNVLTNNPSGILIFGQPGNTLKANTISGSSVAGFDLTGGGASDNVFKANLLTSNAAGIKFGAGWTGNTFLENTIQANTCGIQGVSAGNIFKENLFSANGVDACP
jgi:parallel beta-helix repeat protein